MMASRTVRNDRRGGPRTPAVVAVALESETKPGRQGVTRDVSDNGLLIVTRSHFSKGDRVRIKLHARSTRLDVVGRVVRVDQNPISSPELWPYRVGVALDEPLPCAALVD